MKNTPKRILLIEDEDITAKVYISILEKEGFSVVRASSGEEAVSKAELDKSIDLILADITLNGDIDGVDTAGIILKKCDIPVVFLSEHTGADIVEKAERINSYGFVVKHTGDALLMASIRMAFRLYEANMNVISQNQEVEAANEEMQAAIEEMEAINQELIDTQQSLIKSESELKSLFNALLVGVGMIVDRKFLKVNRYLCNLLGYEESEMIGNLTRIIYIDDDEYERIGRELYGMMLREGHGITKARVRHKDGDILDALISLTPVDPDNLAAGVCATFNDITELNRAENALRESEMKFKAVMEQSTLPMLILDMQGTLVDANESWMKMWSADIKAAIGKYNILEDPPLDGIKPLLNRAFTGEALDFPEYYYDRELAGREGGDLWITGRAYPLKDGAGRVNNIVIIIEDITKRKMAEEALRVSEEKFRNIFYNMTVGYFRTGIDGSLIDINPACLKTFGFSGVEDARERLNNTTSGVYSSRNEWQMVRDRMLSGAGSFSGIVNLRRSDGTEFKGGLNMRLISGPDGDPQFIEGLVDDVTEREKTQEMLIQSEKMITVAGLAAGMAHEINNPLGIIMQNAENALHRMLDDLPGNIAAAEAAGTDLNKIKEYVKSRRVDQYLGAVRDAGGRAAKIVSNMLKFSRGTESKFDYLNVNVIIDKALDLASNDYDLAKNYDFRNIKITREYGELPDIPCAETQLEQVFLNLLKNSAEAMFESGKAIGEHKIIVKTVHQNGYIKIEFKDNGPGMDAATKKRVFEPFFTAGKVGGGTGLGLSVSYHIIVTGHGGSITVESEPGEGTRFIISLPVQRRGF